jgi:hypothetical protein
MVTVVPFGMTVRILHFIFADCRKLRLAVVYFVVVWQNTFAAVNHRIRAVNIILIGCKPNDLQKTEEVSAVSTGWAIPDGMLALHD